MSETNSSSKQMTLRLLRDLVGHAIERRLHALEPLEVGVHFLHEAIEVRAALLRDRVRLA